MSFTRFSLLSLLLMVFVFTTTSCEKEDPLQNPNANNSEPRMLAVLTKSLPTDSTGVSQENQCFVFNFPLSFVLEDGSTVTFDNEDALYDNMGSPIVNFVYPFTITLTDGTVNSINNFEELFSILTTCFGEYEDWDEDDEWDENHDCDDFYFEDFEECFSIVYPLTIIAPDSSQVVFNGDEELFDFLEELSHVEEEDYDFVFPFQVIVESLDETVTIEDYDDLEELFDFCYELYEEEDDDDDDDDDDEDDCPDDFDFDDFADCFSLVYPLGVSGPDGTVTTLNSDDELLAFLENLDEEEAEEYDFVFPFQVVLVASGEPVTIDDYDALDDVFDGCDE